MNTFNKTINNLFIVCYLLFLLSFAFNQTSTGTVSQSIEHTLYNFIIFSTLNKVIYDSDVAKRADEGGVV